MKSVILRLSVVALALLVAPTIGGLHRHRDRRDADGSLQTAEEQANLQPAELEPEVFGGENGERTDREKRLLLEKKVQIGNSIKNTLLNLVFGKINQVIDTKTQLISVFDRANAIKNQQLLGPGTKRPPASANPLKAVFGSLLSSSVGGLGSSSGGSGGGSGSGGLGASFGASLGGGGGGASFGAAASTGSSSSSSSSSGNTNQNIPEFDENKVSLDIPDQLFGSGFTLVTNISEILGSLIMNTARRVQRFVESLKPGLRKFFGASTNARKRSAAGANITETPPDLDPDLQNVDSKSIAAASAEFKSITGIEPFDFDFNALDRLVHSGDDRRASSQSTIASTADLAASAKVASDLLSKNLPSRTLASRSSKETPQTAQPVSESISRSMNSIPAFKPLPRSITDAFKGL